jgi:hypothetical protein
MTSQRMTDAELFAATGKTRVELQTIAVRFGVADWDYVDARGDVLPMMLGLAAMTEEQRAACKAERERLAAIAKALNPDLVVNVSRGCVTSLGDPYDIWPPDARIGYKDYDGRIFVCTADGPWLLWEDLSPEQQARIKARTLPEHPPIDWQQGRRIMDGATIEA